MFINSESTLHSGKQDYPFTFINIFKLHGFQTSHYRPL